MSLDGDGCRIYKGEPEGKLVQEIKYQEGPDGETGPHMENFLAAVRSRKYQDLHAEVEIGRISADLCHLANISYRLGGRLLPYDSSSQKFEDAEANRLAHPAYRAPYVIPELA
ncbi:MAG: hypothetical protein ACJ72H_00950 [Candidatus Sulfotelmatobacter sp.]